MDAVAIINGIGALCFGIVIGWICYRTIRRSSTSGLSDIATVIGELIDTKFGLTHVQWSKP